MVNGLWGNSHQRRQLFQAPLTLLFALLHPQNTPVGTPIFIVNATDPDLGAGGSVLYSFQPPSPFFAIDSARGIVTVVRELDYETTQAYQLTVNATVSPRPRSLPPPTLGESNATPASFPAGQASVTGMLARVTIRIGAVLGQALELIPLVKSHSSPISYVI